MTEKLIDIGFISKAHGFNGEVLCVISGERELPSNCRFLFLQLEGKPVPFLIEEKKDKGGNLLLKFEDVNDEASAKKLAGSRLFIEEHLLSEETPDFHLENLTGYTVTDQHYGSLGKIVGIEEFPGQMVAKCIVRNKEVLFPLSEDFILEIDEEKKTLAVRLPDGLLDIYLDEE